MSESRRKRIFLLGATFSTNNMGVSALTDGIIKSIFARHQDADIFILDYGKQRLKYDFIYKDKVMPIHLVNMRFSKYIFMRNHILVLLLMVLISKLIPISRLKSKFVSINEYLKQISQADIVASISGGDSFSDIYGLNRFFYYCLPQILVILMGKYLLLLPQTIGPFDRRISRVAAKFVMKHSKFVYSRDYSGLDVVKSLVKPDRQDNKIRFCYDVGFVVDARKPDAIKGINFEEIKKREKYLIGLNISGLLFIGGYSLDNMFGLKIDYKGFVFNLIEYLIENKNAYIALIPHVFGYKSHLESDAVACEKLYQLSLNKYNGRIGVIEGIYNQREIKYIIGQSDFFIGSRMHACIAALSQNIPTVPIAYSNKFYGVMETIGLEHLIADPRKMNADEMLDIIGKSFEQKLIIKNHLEKIIPQVKETVLGLFGDIDNLVK